MHMRSRDAGERFRISSRPGLPAPTLASLRLMAEGGEYGELAIELTATLVKTQAIVNPEEQQELRILLDATGLPTHLVDQLAVRD